MKLRSPIAFVLGALALQGPTTAQVRPAKADTPRRPPIGASTRLNRVLYDRSEDGAQLACGAAYKAVFDARGATYVPFLGSKAPRNFPATFRLESVLLGSESIGFDATAVPTREGDAVSFERGSVVETYLLRPDSVEQTLRLEHLDRAGDLVVRYAVETELEMGVHGGGLAFENAFGAVRYGSATAIDATGASCACATELAEGAVEIRVPAAFLAGAIAPLVIDPVLSTFAVNPTASDEKLADVAYDSVHDRYLVVFERTYSAADHDAALELYRGDGTWIASGLADASPSRYWANPKVAYSRGAGTFLVVAEDGDPSSGARTIAGRIVYDDLAAWGLWLGSSVTISQAAQSGEKVNPDVGADSWGASGSSFVVVWERVYSPTDHDIHARQVVGDGSLPSDTILIDDSGGTFDQLPSISESCGFLGLHGVAWERRLGTTNSDVHAAQVDSIGNVLLPATPIVTGIAETANPAVASVLPYGSQWLIVYERSIAGSTDTDVHAVLMSGLTVQDTVDLSALESATGSGTLSEWQVHPEADSDGGGFVVAYAESYFGSSTDYDVYEAKLTPIGSKLHLTEGHVNLAYHPSLEDHPRIVCDASDGERFGLSLAVWDDEISAGSRDVYAAWFFASQVTSFCFPGADAIACPCGNPGATGRGCNNSSATGGARLEADGETSLSLPSLVFWTQGERPTALSILVQGTAAANNVFGQGVRCVGGQLKRLYVKHASSGSILAPTRDDSPVPYRSAELGYAIEPGETLAYLVYYRDPIVLGGCPASSTFNATNSAAVTWRP